jgi:hypothetical protein
MLVLTGAFGQAYTFLLYLRLESWVLTLALVGGHETFMSMSVAKVYMMQPVSNKI